MNSRPKILQVPDDMLGFGARGENLTHWIHGVDLRIPVFTSKDEFVRSSDEDIVGAQFYSGWVIFYGLQVIQIAPEEVHSHWQVEIYYKDKEFDPKQTNVWEIEDSEWLASFSQRHLAGHRHFIIDFYDETVEVICKDLIFGKGKFSIQKAIKQDKRFASAYLRKAKDELGLGNTREAIIYFQKYIEHGTNEQSIEYAKRSIDFLLKAKDK